jgi:hypothetical protein
MKNLEWLQKFVDNQTFEEDGYIFFYTDDLEELEQILKKKVKIIGEDDLGYLCEIYS